MGVIQDLHHRKLTGCGGCDAVRTLLYKGLDLWLPRSATDAGSNHESFNQSPLGAFSESELKARGGGEEDIGPELDGWTYMEIRVHSSSGDVTLEVWFNDDFTWETLNDPNASDDLDITDYDLIDTHISTSTGIPSFFPPNVGGCFEVFSAGSSYTRHLYGNLSDTGPLGDPGSPIVVHRENAGTAIQHFVLPTSCGSSTVGAHTWYGYRGPSDP